MFFSSIESIQESNPEMTPLDTFLQGQRYQPTIGEYAQASMAQAYDRTGLARAVENIGMMWREGDVGEQGPAIRYFEEDAWKASSHFRPGIRFEPGMSEVKAKTLADNFDQRRKRDEVINGGDKYGNSWLYTPVGFGAGLIGSIPDPVNLIPGGVGLRGAQLAGKTFGQLFKKSVVPGLVSGAGGNFLSSSYAAYDLNPKGEDITFQDVMLDTMMGAVLGVGFATGGAAIGRKRTRTQIRNTFSEMNRVLSDQGIENVELSKAMEALSRNEPEAYATYGKQLESVIPGSDTYNQAIDFWRNRATPEVREKMAQAMETALTQFHNGENIDVGTVLRKSNAIESVTRAVEEFQKFQAEDFSTLRQSTEQRLAEVNTRLTQAEASVRVGDDLVNTSSAAAVTARSAIGVPREDLQFVNRNARHARRASEAARRELDSLTAEKLTLERRLREIEDAGAKFADTRNMAEAVEASRVANENVNKATADLAKVRAEKITPSQKKKIGQLEKALARAQKELDTSSTVLDRFQQLDEMKANLEKVDWTAVDPDSVPPLIQEHVTQDMAIDKDGISMEERILREEGILTPEDQATMADFAEEVRSIDRMKSAAKFIASCVMGH